MKKRSLRLLKMLSKLTFYGIGLQFFLIGILYAYEGSAQQNLSVHDYVIDLKVENASIEEVFKNIELKTNYRFFYDKKAIDPDVRITFNERKTSVGEILLQISKESDLKFKQINQTINVNKKTGFFNHKSPSIEVVLQDNTVTGKVTSIEDGGFRGLTLSSRALARVP